MRFAEKAILVTGGTRGIGRAIADRIVAEGGKVAILDRTLAKELSPNALAIRGSVAREPDVKRAIAKTIAWAGRLDGIVNNAGIADPDAGPPEKLALATWNAFLGVNLTGAFLVAKHAIPALRKTRGAIVNIGSTRAVQSEPDTIAYAATKGGLAALTHALAISVGPEVRANCIEPGWIDTVGKKLRAIDHAQHPVGRVGRPEDIASLCAWLLSDEAGFVTGATYVSDGGMTRKMIYA